MLKDIGRAFLAHGAKAVILMSRNAEKNGKVATELSAYGVCVSEAGDVRKPEDCKRVVSNTVAKFGRVDILVNGAAGNFLASASKLSTNGFRTVLEIDTLGTFTMSQSVFNGFMKDNGGGVIINISAALHWSGTALQVHSASAKAGVDTITKTLAVEWGPFNVRVVGIVPGAIEGTEGFERLGSLDTLNSKEKANAAFAKGEIKKSQEQKFASPINRYGKAEDISNAALYLASPLASYVSGTNLVVDGAANLIFPNFMFQSPQFVEMWSAGKL